MKSEYDPLSILTAKVRRLEGLVSEIKDTVERSVNDPAAGLGFFSESDGLSWIIRLIEDYESEVDES